MKLSSRSASVVRQLTRKYLWWSEPAGVPHGSQRVIAQVMELGTHEDAESLRNAVGDDVLRDVLRTAEPGWFSEKSWNYWHYTLGVASFGQAPELPCRRFR